MNLPNEQLLTHLEQLDRRYTELEHQLAERASQHDSQDYQQLSKELTSLKEMVMTFRTYRRIEREIEEAEQLVHAKGESDLRELARDEVVSLRAQQVQLLEQLHRIWEEEHQTPERPIIVEIRAATGGLEASLFAADLYRMYTKYADKKGWTLELMSYAGTEAGGIKEVVFSLSGKECSKRLKWESGVHRVQRVPATEASGRIHTSAVTVAILFEPEEIDLEIDPKDLKIDVYRSSGPGGQSVNTPDSAVRVTHLPTAMVVVCQDERSQLKNRAKAMRILRARLLDKMQQDAMRKEAALRKSQVGSGDRSEKIRTYNFPGRRVTDHRVAFTSHQLEAILDGDMEELTNALMAAEREVKESAAG